MGADIPPVTRKGIKISRGLQGQDDNLDALSSLFEQLQLLTIDASSPQLDLLTFAHGAYYFGVLTEVAEVSRERSPPETDRESTWSTEDEEKFGTPKRGSSPEPNDLSPPALWPSSTAQKGFSTTPEQRNSPPLSDSDYESNLEAYLDGRVQVGLPSTKSGKLRYEAPAFVPASSSTAYDNYPYTNPSWTSPSHPSSSPEPLVGIVYLTSSQIFGDLSHVGELNIGIILEPEFRKKGYARKAIQMVLETAFQDHSCHRIQAVIVDSWAKDRALNLFMQSRFGHEGTRRRAFYGPFDSEWKDTTYLAMLDTDWIMRNAVSPRFRVAPKSLWDELFARHQREREELLRWEERNHSLKRTMSMETVREKVTELPSSVPTSGDEAMTGSITSSSRRVNGKKRRIDVGSGSDAYDASASESENEFEQVAAHAANPTCVPEPSDKEPPSYDTAEWIARMRRRSASPALTESSQSSASTQSDDYTTSASSPWDHMESASDGSPSDFGYQMLNLESESESDPEF